ncbi:MAG: hypothetical protein WB471_09855 [Nocardioides sp.]
MGMRPIDQSVAAEEQYGPFMWGEVDLFERFLELSVRVREAVPECVGMSASLREHGVTLTVVSSDDLVGALDAVQYVDGGPCVQALTEAETFDGGQELDLDRDWLLFAETTRHHQIASTLSLPVPWEGSGMMGFNLYASTSTAFRDKHEELAELLGAWAGGARVDADLLFRSRDLAERAPTILHEATVLAVLASRLAGYLEIDADEAQERLRSAALRAGVPIPTLVEVLREVVPGLPPGLSLGE